MHPEYTTASPFIKQVLHRMPEEFISDWDLCSENFENEFRQNLKFADPVLCKNICEQFAIPGTRPEHYVERFIAHASGEQALVGIRFRGRNKDFPFIEMWPTFNPLEKIEVFQDLAKNAFAEFGIFNPKGIRFQSFPSSHLPDGFSNWEHLVAGKLPIDFLLKNSLPKEFEVHVEEKVSSYEKYQQEYLLWMEDHPLLAPYLRIEDIKDLEEAAQFGRLYGLYKNKKWAGWIGIQERSLYGQKSIAIFEKFIAKEFRGLGLGKLFEAHVLKLQSSPSIWGTIHDQNLPSLKSAISQGRKIVETNYFYTK